MVVFIIHPLACGIVFPSGAAVEVKHCPEVERCERQNRQDRLKKAAALIAKYPDKKSLLALYYGEKDRVLDEGGIILFDPASQRNVVGAEKFSYNDYLLFLAAHQTGDDAHDLIMAAAAAGGTACDFLYFLKFALDVGKAVRLRKCAVMRTLTGKLCGFEALARWESPTHGRLSPENAGRARDPRGGHH